MASSFLCFFSQLLRSLVSFNTFFIVFSKEFTIIKRVVVWKKQDEQYAS